MQNHRSQDTSIKHRRFITAANAELFTVTSTLNIEIQYFHRTLLVFDEETPSYVGLQLDQNFKRYEIQTLFYIYI